MILKINFFFIQINQSFIGINKTIEKLNFYLINETSNNSNENKTFVKLLVDIQLNKRRTEPVKVNLQKKYQNATAINSTSHFLQKFKSTLMVMIISDFRLVDIHILSKFN